MSLPSLKVTIYWVAYGNPVGKWVDCLFLFFTGLPVWQSQLESGWDLFVFSFFFFLVFFFPVGKSLACHSPGKWCVYA